MRTLARLLVAGGIAAICGDILWLLGPVARGFAAFHPRDVVLPAVLVGLFGAMGAELAQAVRERDAKRSLGGIAGRWAGGALVLAAISGALALVVARFYLPEPASAWIIVVILGLALAGYALAGGALLVAGWRSIGPWLGALAGVGLGALWGVALALGFGVVYAISFRHLSCPPYRHCYGLGQWEVTLALLWVATAFGVAAGIVLAIAVGLARLILPPAKSETGA
jgi:hypothetical protein